MTYSFKDILKSHPIVTNCFRMIQAPQACIATNADVSIHEERHVWMAAVDIIEVNTITFTLKIILVKKLFLSIHRLFKKKIRTISCNYILDTFANKKVSHFCTFFFLQISKVFNFYELVSRKFADYFEKHFETYGLLDASKDNF